MSRQSAAGFSEEGLPGRQMSFEGVDCALDFIIGFGCDLQQSFCVLGLVLVPAIRISRRLVVPEDPEKCRQGNGDYEEGYHSYGVFSPA